MQLRSIVRIVVMLAGIAVFDSSAGAQQATQPSARLVVISAGDPVGEKMEYSRKQILAKPGERIRLRLVSTGALPKVAMAHNWVLLTLGSDPKKFSEAAAGAAATGYIPPALKGQVIASTDFVGPGEKSEVTFVVPKTPGTYTYICSFAGHYAAGMWGQLIVK